MHGDKIVGFTESARSRGASARELGAGDRRSAPPSEAAPRPASHGHDLFAPAALVCTFDAECANPYGCALLARAYPAWFEKWMPGGAKRTLRLRMIKDAYIGDIFWYPAEPARANCPTAARSASANWPARSSSRAPAAGR